MLAAQAHPTTPLPLPVLLSLAALARSPITAANWAARAHARLCVWALRAPATATALRPTCPRAALAHALALLPPALQLSAQCPLAPLPLPRCTCATPCLWPRAQTSTCACLLALKTLRARQLMLAAVPVLHARRAPADSHPTSRDTRVHAFLRALRRGSWLGLACAEAGLAEQEAEAIVCVLSEAGEVSVAWEWV